jgi:hypothetical protein
MTCTAVPSASTDVVRKLELDSYSPTVAIHIADTTDSSSVATGALIVDGGAAFAKSMFIGGELNMYAPLMSSHNIRLGYNGTQRGGIRYVAGTPATIIFDIIDGADPEDEYIPLRLNKTTVQALATTASTSSSTGALVVSGGIGCQGALNAGGAIVSSNIPVEYAISGTWIGAMNNVERTVYAQKVNNVITLYTKLRFSGTTIADAQATFTGTLPVGYRPQDDTSRLIIIAKNGTDSFGSISVGASGGIVCTDAGNADFVTGTPLTVYAFSVSFSI